MKRQLLILGNGFDLHCGLKSSYNDFADSEIFNSSKTGLKIDFEIGKKGFWESVLFNEYQAKKNLKRWCDIEELIKYTLLLVCFGSQDSQDIDRGIWKVAINWRRMKRDEVLKFIDINDELKKYIYDYCGIFFENFSSSKTIDALLNHLLSELKNFEHRFCKYIKNNIVNSTNKSEINNDYVVKAMNLIANLTEFSPFNPHKLVSQSFNLESTYILSFNYTNPFDILKVESPLYYTNVHGKLCNKDCIQSCQSSSIIFGIDDRLIQAKTECAPLRIFSKTYRKMLGSNLSTKVLPYNNEEKLKIKFYGHSLNEADYSYFQSIFDYYDIYSNSNISLMFYYSEGHEQCDNIYKLINSYGKTLNNKDQGRNLIHKLLLENRLHIVKLD